MSTSRPSLIQRTLTRSFVWLVARAPRSRLAALLAAGLVLLTGSLLLARQQHRSPRVYEGEFRRIS